MTEVEKQESAYTSAGLYAEYNRASSLPSALHQRLREKDAEVERLRAVIEELLPYARASIGLPENSWSSDNVILKARAALAKGPQ